MVEKRRAVGGVVRRAVSEAVAFAEAAASGLEKEEEVVVLLMEEVVMMVRRGGEAAGLVRNLAVFIFWRPVA